MLNLAEMAEKKEEEERVAGEEEEQVLMQVDTGEIKTMEQVALEAAAAYLLNLNDNNSMDPLGASSSTVGGFGAGGSMPCLSSEDPIPLDLNLNLELENEGGAGGATPVSQTYTYQYGSNPSSCASSANGSAGSGGGGSGTSGDGNGDSINSLASDPTNNSNQEQPPQKIIEQSPPPQQYAGFSSDYPDYQNYNYHSTYGAPALLMDKKEQQGFWCCLFPWMNQTGQDLDFLDDEVEAQQQHHILHPSASQESLVSVGEGLKGLRHHQIMPAPNATRSKDDDELSSTGSDVFGEKLSDRERQAVLARLRLSQPDHPIVANSSNNQNNPEDPEDPLSLSPSKQKGKGLLNGITIPTAENLGRLKGILKRSSTFHVGEERPSSQNSLNGTTTGSASSGTLETKTAPKRRSLFPQYETSNKMKKNLTSRFASMARVVTVKSKNEMSEKEKSDVWWQKSDYEEFRKTGRMITRAMLEGGSEIWLASNQSWILPNHSRASTLKSAYTLSGGRQKTKTMNKDQKAAYEDARDKWWHKFGHSRRGLEHIASIDEGRQRQQNVRTAIRAVIDEQKRQKVFHREDCEKLRMASISLSAWARDLSMAAGASDADAVRANFDEDGRKSREFYLLKFARANSTGSGTATNNTKGGSSNKNVPAFMQPILALTHNRFDANTVSQIRFREKEKQAAAASTKSSQLLRKDTPPQAAVEQPVKGVNDEQEEREEETRDSSQRRSDLARRAAGYASGEEIANMSAVLSGMGPEIAAVGGP